MREAIKTEYKGVVYRSKSEAIFARMLDIHTSRLTACFNRWFSEDEIDPVQLKQPMNNHKWDFMTIQSATGYFGSNIQICLVELKPKRPTEQYIKNLREKTGCCRLCFKRYIIAGSPFKLQYCEHKHLCDGFYYESLCLDDRVGNWKRHHNCYNVNDDLSMFGPVAFSSEVVEEAMKYRFDLQQGGVL